MSRWATHRRAIHPRLGRRADGAGTRFSGGSVRDPDGADAVETERAGDVLVEVPVAPADVRAAIVDRRGDGPAAAAEGHLRAAGQAAIRHAVGCMEPAGGGAAVVVPRGDVGERRGDAARAGGAAGVQPIAGEPDTQRVPRTTRRAGDEPEAATAVRAGGAQ